MPTPVLAFDHITVRHLNRVLFSDLCLRLEPGQHWALVGPSGAGKSALLAALTGQLLLDEPGQGLDATQLPYFRAVLEAICAASPVALVYVSH